jgi:predicted dehydrogenase
MGIRVGICGTGAFSTGFIPLFKAHPEVEQVILCDLDSAKLEEKSRRFEIPDTCPSLDDLCEMDLDAVAIFTQHHVHGPQAIQALRSGKHVYSAVPSAISLEEVGALVDAVSETGLVYMLGETSYYYPCAIYCRQRYAQGDFGRIVYAEAEYIHDFDHGLYDVYRWRHGANWREYAGLPPMFYPTHSMSMVVSVTGAHATQVTGVGFVDDHEDGLFDPEMNVWRNAFSNETALCRMSDGSVARFNEFRRVGHPGAVRMSMFGTLGSYEEQVGGQVWVTRNSDETVDLTPMLSPEGVLEPPGDDPMSKVTGSDGTHVGASRVHPVHLLPKEYIGLPSGHAGSHQFLVHDFVTACTEGGLPPNNVWQAARYLVPGLVAHESARQGRLWMEVPDFGDPPPDWPHRG